MIISSTRPTSHYSCRLSHCSLHRSALLEMSSMRQPADRESFHVALICALPLEADAVALLFDPRDRGGDPYGRTGGDTNSYITGRFGGHNVVLVVLPGMGTTDAAVATASLRSSYPRLKLALLVGICGGVPKVDGYDVFLGDVVVSRSIIRYDYGRQYPGRFVIKDSVEDRLGRPNTEIRSLLAGFQTELVRERLQGKATEYLKQLQTAAIQKDRRTKYQNPGPAEDRLYLPQYAHRHRKSCDVCLAGTSFCEAASKASCEDLGCDKNASETRRKRTQDDGYQTQILIGRVGSGNAVMKSGVDRNRIAAEHGLIGFEMEGAGTWDQVPCIVVKGVCDYADSHKDKKWQPFAAATAASVAKAMLERYSASDRPAVAPRGERLVTQNPVGKC